MGTTTKLQSRPTMHNAVPLQIKSVERQTCKVKKGPKGGGWLVMRRGMKKKAELYRRKHLALEIYTTWSSDRGEGERGWLGI